MIKYICDRCGVEIKNKIYHVSITSECPPDIDQSDYDLEDTMRNVVNSFREATDDPRMYCETCMLKIKAFCEEDV